MMSCIVQYYYLTCLTVGVLQSENTYSYTYSGVLHSAPGAAAAQLL